MHINNVRHCFKCLGSDVLQVMDTYKTMSLVRNCWTSTYVVVPSLRSVGLLSHAETSL